MNNIPPRRRTNNLVKLAFNVAITFSIYSASAYELGIEYVSDTSGYAYIVDEGFHGNGFSYVCLNGCYNATLTDGRWQFLANNLVLGQTYTIKTQINASPDQILAEDQVTFSNPGSGSLATPSSTPVPTQAPTQAPATTATITPTPAPTIAPTIAPTLAPTPAPTHPPATGSSCGELGIEYLDADSGLLYYDLGHTFSGGFKYLCIDGRGCYDSQVKGTRLEVQFDGLTAGTQYELSTQIDDNPAIYETGSQVFEAGACSGGSSSGGGSSTTSPTPAPTVAPTSTPTPAPTAAPTSPPTASPTPAADNNSSAPLANYVDIHAGTSNNYGIYFDDGSKIVTTVAARGRRRHEPDSVPGMDPNGNDNPQHFNYHLEYWNDRIYELEIHDYTSYGQSRIDIFLDTIGPHATNSADPNQNRPFVKCNKDWGNSTGYFDAPASGADYEDLGNNLWRYTFRRLVQDNDGPGYNFETAPGGEDEVRELRAGDILHCEVTIRWGVLVTSGESALANYYGEIIRYRVGTGGVVGYQLDPNRGIDITHDSSMIGGHLTSPIMGIYEVPRAYMQPAINTQIDNMDAFLEGRRLMHTSVTDGSHWDPSNGSNGFNPGHSGLALGISNGFEDRCSDCHLDNGNGPGGASITASGFHTPRLVGLGLLEAIPNATIEAWAAEQSDLGLSGRISTLVKDGQNYIGRFGYQASHASISDQVVGAADGEMNMTQFSAQEIDQMATYISLLGVPSARSPDLDNHPGMDEFIEFGCADCHRLNATTDNHRFEELRQQNFRPFTDLLLHDLGEGEFRTTPLMGIGLAGAVHSVAKDPHAGFNHPSGINHNANDARADLINNRNDDDFNLWHDGSCVGANAFTCAINKHGNEAEDASEAFENAGGARQQQLIQFLHAL